MHLIRKISIGKDYKNDAMHYAVGQEVYGGHTIDSIIEEDKNTLYIYLKAIYLCLGRTSTKTCQYLWNIIFHGKMQSVFNYLVTPRRQNNRTDYN